MVRAYIYCPLGLRRSVALVHVPRRPTSKIVLCNLCDQAVACLVSLEKNHSVQSIQGDGIVFSPWHLKPILSYMGTWKYTDKQPAHHEISDKPTLRMFEVVSATGAPVFAACGGQNELQ